MEKEGVKKIGIEPKGKAKWSVAEEDQREVKRQRAMTEASIGVLKSRKYEFNHRRERSNARLRAAGQMILVRKNLNKLMSDIEEKERQGREKASCLHSILPELFVALFSALIDLNRLRVYPYNSIDNLEVAI